MTYFLRWNPSCTAREDDDVLAVRYRFCYFEVYVSSYRLYVSSYRLYVSSYDMDVSSYDMDVSSFMLHVSTLSMLKLL